MSCRLPTLKETFSMIDAILAVASLSLLIPIGLIISRFAGIRENGPMLVHGAVSGITLASVLALASIAFDFNFRVLWLSLAIGIPLIWLGFSRHHSRDFVFPVTISLAFATFSTLLKSFFDVAEPIHSDSIDQVVRSYVVLQIEQPAGLDNLATLKRATASMALLALARDGSVLTSFAPFSFLYVLVVSYLLFRRVVGSPGGWRIACLFGTGFLFVVAVTPILGASIFYINGHILAALGATSFMYFLLEPGGDRGALLPVRQVLILSPPMLLLVLSRPEGGFTALLMLGIWLMLRRKSTRQFLMVGVLSFQVMIVGGIQVLILAPSELIPLLENTWLVGIVLLIGVGLVVGILQFEAITPVVLGLAGVALVGVILTASTIREGSLQPVAQIYINYVSGTGVWGLTFLAIMSVALAFLFVLDTRESQIFAYFFVMVAGLLATKLVDGRLVSGGFEDSFTRQLLVVFPLGIVVLATALWKTLMLKNGLSGSKPGSRSQTEFLDWLSKSLYFRYVYDGGAALGEFSRSAKAIWPTARIYAFEPLVEFRESLQNLASNFQNIEVIEAALLDKPGLVQFFVHQDLVGSSVYKEIEGPIVDGEPRKVRAAKLDSWFRPDGNRLIKLDLQGAELDALRGAERFFTQNDDTETVFLLEVNLFENMIGSDNQFSTVVSFMEERGFVVLDICGLNRRPLDSALAQLDVAFCHRNSKLRSRHEYASPSQRREQFLLGRPKLGREKWPFTKGGIRASGKKGFV